VKVGVKGELEHAAVWHKAAGWAMREALRGPKAIVSSVMVVGSAGYGKVVPTTIRSRVAAIHPAQARSGCLMGRSGF